MNDSYKKYKVKQSYMYDEIKIYCEKKINRTIPKTNQSIGIEVKGWSTFDSEHSEYYNDEEKNDCKYRIYINCYNLKDKNGDTIEFKKHFNVGFFDYKIDNSCVYYENTKGLEELEPILHDLYREKLKDIVENIRLLTEIEPKIQIHTIENEYKTKQDFYRDVDKELAELDECPIFVLKEVLKGLYKGYVDFENGTVYRIDYSNKKISYYKSFLEKIIY